MAFFKIVVQIQISPFSTPPLAPTSHPWSYPPLALSMCPLYIFLDDPSPFFFPVTSPYLSGYCQFVLYFNVSGVSGYILLAYLFCWLSSTYRWDHMVFVYHCLAYFTQHNAVRFHPCCCEGWQFFLSFCCIVFHCVNVPLFFDPLIYWWALRLFLAVGYCK